MCHRPSLRELTLPISATAACIRALSDSNNPFLRSLVPLDCNLHYLQAVNYSNLSTYSPRFFIYQLSVLSALSFFLHESHHDLVFSWLSLYIYLICSCLEGQLTSTSSRVNALDETEILLASCIKWRDCSKIFFLITYFVGFLSFWDIASFRTWQRSRYGGDLILYRFPKLARC